MVTIFLGSLSAILTPCIAHLFGSKGVMGVRAFQGFTQGFVYPSVHGLLSKWVPISERSRLGTFVYAGKNKKVKISIMKNCNHIVMHKFLLS